MEKLKTGDKVCHISKDRWSNNIYYRFDEVERLTKTQAILKSGIRLINEPTKGWNEDFGFMIHGDRFNKYFISNNEIEEKAKKETERQSVNNWFHAQKFNQEQIIKIYKLFNTVVCNTKDNI